MCETLFNFVDVGSCGGLVYPWSTSHIDTIIKIDPRESETENDKTIIYHACLSDYNGYIKFYIFNKKDCSSTSLPCRKMALKKKFKIVETQDIKCYTLDSILDNHDIKFDFLKLDTQGAELLILRGGQRHLMDFAGLHLEVFTTRVYKQSNSLKEISEFLLGFSFVPIGIVSKGKRHGDYLFVSTRPENQKKVNCILQLYREKLTANPIIEFYKEVFL